MAVKNVTVVVLDVNPIQTENCAHVKAYVNVRGAESFTGNIHYYKCDVSNWEEVQTVSKEIIEEVCVVSFEGRVLA